MDFRPISGCTWILALGLVAFLSAPGPLAAQSVWTLVQVTDFVPVGDYSLGGPALSGDGRFLGVYSDRDFDGENPNGGNEVFLLEARSGAATAITAGDGNFSTLTGPHLDGAGEAVGFFFYPDSLMSTGAFLWRSGSGNTEILPDAYVADLSNDGEWLAIFSEGDPTGGNPDGSQELFLYDVTGTSFTQITSVPGDEHWFSAARVSDGGTRVVFVTTADLVGTNVDGSQEIYLWESGQPSPISQLTDFGADDSIPEFQSSADGTRSAFISNDDLTGGNPDLNWEVFLLDLDSRSLVQVTDTTGGGQYRYLGVSGSGSRLAIVADVDLTGGNPDLGRELFLYDIAGATMTQLTDLAPGQIIHPRSPAIDFAGARIALYGMGDLTGGDADGSGELYLTIEGHLFYDGFESGNLGAWSPR